MGIRDGTGSLVGRSVELLLNRVGRIGFIGRIGLSVVEVVVS